MSLSNRSQILLSILILILGIAWIGISSIYFLPEENNEIAAPQKGFPVPDFTLLSPNGTTYRLSDYHGQAVLLNIWASWCAPCKAEMPVMQEVYETYKDQGFTILAVNAAHQDNRNSVIKFTTDLSLTFPILLDSDGIVTSLYKVNAFPTSYFIDRTGNIHEIFTGGPVAEVYLITRIETLLTED